MHGKKMPISRDISVPQRDEKPTEDSVRLAKGTPSDANVVKVMGFGKDDLLFRSDSVGTVEWHDSDGRPVALLVRIKPDMWGFSRRGEPDWLQVLGKYGNG